MTENEYLALCEKYLNGHCTPGEEARLQQYQNEFGMAEEQWSDSDMGDQEHMKRLLYSRLQQSMKVRPKPDVRKLTWKYAAAASVLIFLCVGIYISNRSSGSRNPSEKKSTVFKNDIRPGSNKAVLTLADGSHIVLDNAKKGVLTRQGGTAVTKSANGLIVYNFNKTVTQPQAANHLNTITIPRGGKYQIVLPDGTNVWLNSSSTLTFPTSFAGAERDVQLTGEAYFEVAKKKRMPFKVMLNNNTEVKVLGTHFNIMAYDDEPEVRTTLLEGSVKLTNKQGNVLLAPGQQGVIERKDNAAFRVRDVNTAQDIAWKNGSFMFVNDDIRSIMKRVSRWYNVDIEYTSNITDRTFTGTISQFENITEVLKLLQLTGAVHFKIEERRILVMQ
ncbi:FecR family protein [Mucilaginibacter sabulilitoris]|uniref:FecR family protein n=1 Tax=Mucilaginibacter sabulilitoris TaxID=1173583 RepID=A0ABZ0TWN3_9SPHI|nr:FecR family protein [Mucilaginibacter sabulilitoris]WPU96907.1 FecR family protein [Mucilaginibacter sabulilitoris]